MRRACRSAFDPVLTIVSLIVAIAGTGIGFALARLAAGPGLYLLGGALVGLAISTMHFTGMAAYRIDGVVAWRWPYRRRLPCCAR